ncbi:glycerol-3-phosphate dehydrogenase subunit GlpB [Enterobacter sp. Bisph1]|uniref:glycerol-3-phosphate dehydrogenase subunit GlpB n=1 Tax=Enterobacter sp. Bisph1 TaxID=1274399 RepID=UPI00057BEF80|nr:glycerol-3-phosphate dehydrogenase subunit GlpB [Enterobacter sp. Bisph1]
MKFDTVIIGGGLAGLLCGIRLLENGQRCAIVSRGQSALSFSSGSLDLLSHLPDGQPIATLDSAIDQLQQNYPEHPYALLGAEAVRHYAHQTQTLLADCGLALQGDIATPHQRITPLGTLRQAWLSPTEVPVKSAANPRTGVVGISGFLDFQPQLAAGALRQRGIDAHAEEIELPLLDPLRDNPSEFRAVNIARLLDVPEHFDALYEALKPLSQQYAMLFLPACFGLADNRVFTQLNQQLACPLHLLPTLPPSVPGMRMQSLLQQRFIRSGGSWMPGDEVLRADIINGQVMQLWTRKHEDIALRARHVVLASGSFFSNGLIAGRDRVREAVFDLDVLQSAERESWYRDNVFDSQPWQQFGVQTDGQLHGLRQGKPVSNLYVIGSVLGGFDPIAQGCGGGVCAVTALYAAQQICAQGGE